MPDIADPEYLYMHVRSNAELDIRRVPERTFVGQRKSASALRAFVGQRKSASAKSDGGQIEGRQNGGDFDGRPDRGPSKWR